MATLTGFQSDRVGTYIEKDPYAILDYSLDWTDWMPQGDTIATTTVTAETIAGDSAPLAIDSTANTNYVLTAIISGGTAGKIYNVEYRIVTTNGKRDSRNFRIKVLERQAV
ncbi:minor tail protein [Phage DSL-LC06]|nr:minor tail protein [Phage DSL-LC06]